MSKFVRLSKTIVNVDTIRMVYPVLVKAKEGERVGCTVFFNNSAEPYAFYGEDAAKILEALEKRLAQEEVGQN